MPDNGELEMTGKQFFATFFLNLIAGLIGGVIVGVFLLQNVPLWKRLGAIFASVMILWFVAFGIWYFLLKKK